MGSAALSSYRHSYLTKIASPEKMIKLVVSSCLVGLALSQYGVESQAAKILKEQRFNAGDGRFGSAYAQEDGTVFREESGAGGERIGQYSYVDQAGKTINVKYSAGVDGFQILEGAHVPIGSNGQNSAPHDPNYREPAPAPVQQAAPAYNQYNNNNNQYNNNNNQYNNYVQPTQAPNPNRNPFINPDDPTHNNFQYNINAAQYSPQNPYSQQVASVPACADCGGTNPFINPYDPTHQGGYVQPQQPAAPAYNQYNKNNQYNTYTTQAPKRFFPPGKLSLSRFETGFNFDFES